MPSIVPVSPEIKTLRQANDKIFNDVKSRWDQATIDEITESKALLLGRDDNIIGVVDFAQNLPDPSLAFAAAQKENASSLMIVQNDPEDRTYPDKKFEQDVMKSFKDASSTFGIPFRDFLFFSRWGYRSSLENNKI